MLTELFCCRSLICRLEEVDPRKLKHQEKLSFWINIHNALVMHVMVLFHRILLLQSLTPFCWFRFYFCCERKWNVSFAVFLQAYLAYGIPQNNVKRHFLLLKVRRPTFDFYEEDVWFYSLFLLLTVPLFAGCL